MANVLITGGTGFIGNHLARTLLARGDQVSALVRDVGRGDGLRKLGARLVIGTLEQADKLQEATQGVDIVYHLAGLTKTLDTADFFRVNELGSGLLAQACAKQTSPPTLVIVSSLAAAGPSPRGNPRDETLTSAPVSDYGRSKLGGENAALAEAERVPITIVRPPMVLGPGDKISFDLYKSIAKYHMHFIPGFDPKEYSWIDARSLVQGIILAAERGERCASATTSKPGQGIYYLADVEQWTYRQLGAAIATALGNPFYLNFRMWNFFTSRVVKWSVIWAKHRELEVPYLNWDKFNEIRTGDWTCNTKKARQQLGFVPGDPQTLLNEAAAWYREKGWL
jgi:nucleoside-diphosphate-sugar epimerase